MHADAKRPMEREGFTLWAQKSEAPPMSTLVEELSARAKTLPPEDRARLAAELLDSLHIPPDPDADAEWDGEIERRVTDIQSGAVKLVPADEVHAEAIRLIQG